MLVSHETPISILDHSRNYNDYDYALVHLFDTHPKYYNFFKSSLNLGREVMLDNSIFELGTAFDSEKFADYVRELKPTYYIIPDVLEECDATIASYYHFTQDYQMLYKKALAWLVLILLEAKAIINALIIMLRVHLLF